MALFPLLSPLPAPCHASACTADHRIHHVREPAVSKVFAQGTLLHDTLLSTGGLAPIVSTRKIWRQKSHQRQQMFRALALAPARRDRFRACHRSRQQPSFASPNLQALESSRGPSLLHLHRRHSTGGHTPSKQQGICAYRRR